MTVTDFLNHLNENSTLGLTLRLPDGSDIEPNFHVTEVGHVKRRFVDCGGTRREVESCLLQTWVADDVDHRLKAGKLAGIFGYADEILPHRDLPVEIEHEKGVISQYPVRGAVVEAGHLVLQLGLKHTDCLAKELCLPGVCGPECKPESAPAPAPALAAEPAIKLVVTKEESCCAGGGCC